MTSSDSDPTILKLNVSCKDFIEDDEAEKKIRLVVVSEERDRQWVEIGRAEKKEEDDKFKTPILAEYRFEARQNLKFEVFGDDLLASVTCWLSRIVSAPNKTYEGHVLGGPNKGGKIVVTWEEIKESKKSVVTLTLSGKLQVTTSRSYFVLSHVDDKGSSSAIYKSNPVEQDPFVTIWDPATVPAADLCSRDGDTKREEIKVEMFLEGEGDKPIGSFTTSLSGLVEASMQHEPFTFDNNSNSSKSSSNNSNKSDSSSNNSNNSSNNKNNDNNIFVRQISIGPDKNDHTFLDHIQSGLELNFSVAVDFTASNGNVKDPNSLHFFKDDDEDNQYTSAIRAVGEIIQDYGGSERDFLARGFGAKIPPKGDVSHNFPLTLDVNKDTCVGVEGILSAYRTCLDKVKLLGPTNFAPVIREVTEAAANKEDFTYHVLVIVTDGIVTDAVATKDAIVAAAKAGGVSVIIVGVGETDFSDMAVLDGDVERLRASDGTEACRDIVQFVEMRKFLLGKEEEDDKDGKKGRKERWDMAGLAREVLGELPDQLARWTADRRKRKEEEQDKN